MVQVAYHRVYNILREKIMDNTMLSGDKLPPERELCDMYGVSRITIRQALQMLQNQGLVERLPGKGTFVRNPSPKKMPILDMDYENSLKKEAPDIVRSLLSWLNVSPPEDVREELGLLKSQQCVLIERLDILDEEPLSYDKGYIPLGLSTSITSEIICQVEFLHLWAKLEGLSISYIQSAIEAVKATAEDTEKLGVPLLSPVLMITDIIYASDSKALAVFITKYRADRFKLVSTYPFKRD